jgi:hypothetical protein
MKRRLAPLLIVASIALGSTGCAGGLQNLITQAEIFEVGMQTALSIAQTTWANLYPNLPANVQAEAQPLYNDAITGLQGAITELDDGITLATQANNPNPDLSVAIAAVAQALTTVINVIDQFKGPTTPKGYALLLARRDALVRQAAYMKKK